MNFKTGDRVRFLNASGGGIVTRILGPNMVNVAIEDGFEIPTLTSEIIRVDSDAILYRHAGEKTPPKEPVPETKTPDNSGEGFKRTSRLEQTSGFASRPEGIYLCYQPLDQKWILTGHMNVFLVNHTAYDILFSLFLQDTDGKLHGMDYDGLPPRSRMLLSTINRDDLPVWSRGIIQVLFHSDSPGTVLMPLHGEFRIKETRFLKESNYIDTPFIDGKAFILTLGETGRIPRTGNPAEKKEEEGAFTTVAQEQEEEGLLEKTESGSAEVDLHIEMLTDDFEGLDSHARLELQLRHFRRSLEEGFHRKFEKIIFIHGMGNGTLRRQITAILKEYEGIEFQDAPYKLYGSGAIEVHFLRNSYLP